MVDSARNLLDHLMGQNRNKPLLELKGVRDHYSDKDVCKPFLICFCFNTLFPSTSYYEGECPKRHDAHLKNMFLADENRTEQELEYIEECIGYIEKKLREVDLKIKKNKVNVDNKTTLG
jgi:hypothetical protein